MIGSAGETLFPYSKAGGGLSPARVDTQCERTNEESGTVGGRKEKEFNDEKLPRGKHPTI